MQLQRSCWESFRAKVRQAFVEEETPIALFKDPHTGLMIIIKKVHDLPSFHSQHLSEACRLICLTTHTHTHTHTHTIMPTG